MKDQGFKPLDSQHPSANPKLPFGLSYLSLKPNTFRLFLPMWLD